jgi:hypothetical protein
MSLAPLGVLDLSVVTGLLVDTVNNYWPTSPLWSTLAPASKFTATVSGATPDEVRKASTTTGMGLQVTISLIHVEPNKFNRNFVYSTPPPVPNPPAQRAQGIPTLPLSLDLFYFVSAYSENSNAIQEQQALSIVLNCFHQTPIIRKNVIVPGSPPDLVPEEFTLTMEVESVDSISRFWQATTVPFRLSVMYRVAVVFLTPPAPPLTAKQVSKFTLSADPVSFPFAFNGEVSGSYSSTTFITPDSSTGTHKSVTVEYSPATVTTGQRFFVYGSGLNQGTDYTGPAPNPGTSYRVYLSGPPDYQTADEITKWKTPDSGSPSQAIQTSERITLDVPATVGTVPANAPPPGVYSLVVGSDAGPDAITYRTNSTPFNLAALVNAPGSPSLPIINDVAGTYTVAGMGFVANHTEVLLETVVLSSAGGPPGPGEFSVIDVATIKFMRPANLPSGRYAVRVRVNGVESPPAVWISF